MAWAYSEKTKQLFVDALHGKPGTRLGEREHPDGFGVHAIARCLGDAATRLRRRQHGPDVPTARLDALAATGGGDAWKPPRIKQEGCGTGKCEGTVQYDGRCYRAGEMNYILYGRINRLCRDSVGSWTRFKGLDANGQPIYKDLRGRRIYYRWWSPDAVLFTTLYYRLGQRFGLIPELPSAPVGPGGTSCRVWWTLSGYGKGRAPTKCQVKECGTDRCTEPYSGAPFLVRVSGQMLP